MATADKLQTIIDNNETIKGHVADSLLAVEAKGVTLPDDAKLANLPTLIAGIESGGSDDSILPTIPPMVGTGEHMVRFVDHNGVFLIHKVDDGASIDLDSIVVPQYAGLSFVEFISDRSLSNISYNVDVGVFYKLNPDENNGFDYAFDYQVPYGGASPTIVSNTDNSIYWGDGQYSTDTSKSGSEVIPSNTIPCGRYRATLDFHPNYEIIEDFDIRNITGIYTLKTAKLSGITFTGIFVFDNYNDSGIRFIVGTNGLSTLSELSSGYVEAPFSNCVNLTAFIGNAPEEINATLMTYPNYVDIPAYAFGNCSNLSAVVLSGAVTEIHAYAFLKCISLTQLIIPSAMQYISGTAFDDCTLLTLLDMATVTNVPVLTESWTPANPDLKILVPSELYSDFLDDEVWALMSDYIISA